jgi:hypothetical protein
MIQRRTSVGKSEDDAAFSKTIRQTRTLGVCATNHVFFGRQLILPRPELGNDGRRPQDGIEVAT